MEKVFITTKDRAIKIVDNEAVKRFGEAKYYDSSVFGIEKKGVVVIVRGDESLFENEVFNGLEELEGGEKEKVLEKLKEMEESAATGVGLIFG